MLKIAIIIALLMGALSSGLGVLYINSVKQHAQTKLQLEAKDVAIQALNASIANMAQAQASLEGEKQRLQLSFNESERKLLSLKNREEIVLKKKSLVSRKINKAFSAQQARLACITGDTKLCEN